MTGGWRLKQCLVFLIYSGFHFDSDKIFFIKYSRVPNKRSPPNKRTPWKIWQKQQAYLPPISVPPKHHHHQLKMDNFCDVWEIRSNVLGFPKIQSLEDQHFFQILELKQQNNMGIHTIFFTFSKVKIFAKKTWSRLINVSPPNKSVAPGNFS